MILSLFLKALIFLYLYLLSNRIFRA